jgi:hypothetical protein
MRHRALLFDHLNKIIGADYRLPTSAEWQVPPIVGVTVMKPAAEALQDWGGVSARQRPLRRA